MVGILDQLHYLRVLIKKVSIKFSNITICFTELPADKCLDDLGNLINIDTKTFNAEILGAEVIKEQQAINLKFSSRESALIPEDRAQIMLTSVSFLFAFKREVFK